MFDHPRCMSEPIAIVGSSCRFPGGASSPSKLWELLRQPRDVLSEIPPTRFDVDKFYHPDNTHPGTSNVRHAYILSEDFREFDASFFGIKPVEASAIDPQQRLLLETAYESLESAGISLETLQDSDTGVFVGLMNEDYSTIAGRDIQQIPSYLASGTARNNISNRISYFFNLHGPSMTIDTACSSSLVALHQAVQSLRGGECSAALVGGANLLLAPEPYVSMSNLKMLSPSGRCRMWDKDADGYARGDGFAVVVAKTLSRALADRDHIEYLVRETGINQDGRTKGITMPSAAAQANLIRATYARAGLDLSRDSDRPQYFEAHGTGTPTGDPLEAEAISSVFFDRDSASSCGPLYVGSIKTIIGHTEGTAGLAGLMKASLALRHGIIPPNLHLGEISDTVKPFYTNLEIARTAQDWPKVSPNSPRRAIVNSFGFGGSNCVAIIESFESDEQMRRNDDVFVPMVPFNFSAASDTSLSASLSGFASFIKANTSLSLRDLSWTLNARRSTLPIRISLSATDSMELASKLEQRAKEYNVDGESSQFVASQSSTSALATNDARVKPRLLGIFTGQGAQWAAMGAELLTNSSVASACFDRLQEALDILPSEHRPSWSLRDELLRRGSSSHMHLASFSQPLCTAVQIVIVELLRLAKMEFAAMVGHSSGEIALAFAAGHISERDAIRIAYYRGLFLDLAGEGAMLAVTTSHEDAQHLCDLPSMHGRICVAAYNSLESVTLSGDIDAVQDAEEIFADEGKFCRRLRVDRAYHSHHMTRCANAYFNALGRCDIGHPLGQNQAASVRNIRRPIWISSVSGQEFGDVDPSCLKDSYWVDNMVRPVLFSQALEYAIGAHGPYHMAVEIGPHPALQKPVLETFKSWDIEMSYTGTLARGKTAVDALANALGSVWAHLGHRAIDFDAFDSAIHGAADGGASLVKGLPSYPWMHSSIYWHETRQGRAFRSSSSELSHGSKNKRPHPLLGTLCPDETGNEFRFRNCLRQRDLPWLSHHQIQGQIVFPAAGYISAVVEAMACLRPLENFQLVEISEILIGKALIFSENTENSGVDSLLSIKLMEQTIDHVEAVFSFFSAESLNSRTSHGKDQSLSSAMSENASGKIRVVKAPLDLPLPEPHAPGNLSQFLPVEAPDFYASAAELGYGYQAEFQGLCEIQRKMNEATGSIRVPTHEKEMSLIVHPATLDCAIQAILLAYSYPGDGRLRELHVPTRIERIDIDLAACQESASRESSVGFYASVTPDTSATGHLSGDVEIQSANGRQTMLQLQGLQAVPLVSPSEDNDIKLFFDLVWAPESYSTATVWGKSADLPTSTTRATEFKVLADRIAHFYMRRLITFLQEDDTSAKSLDHWRLLTEFLGRRLASTAQNVRLNIYDDEWASDTDQDILEATQQCSPNLDLDMIQFAGNVILDTVRQKAVPDGVMRSTILRDFDAKSPSVSPHLEGLSRIMKHLVHRFSHMHILEISGKHGSEPIGNTVLNQIVGDYSSYTVAFPNEDMLQEARAGVSKETLDIASVVLDIEGSETSCELADESYDIIILPTLALLAQNHLPQAFSNLRRLMRPGGYLVTLELEDDGSLRTGLMLALLSSGLLRPGDNNAGMASRTSAQDWEALAQKAGFSSIHRITHPRHEQFTFPMSISLFQALDERVEFLREPLVPNAASPRFNSLTIICEDHDKRQRMHTEISHHFSHVLLVDSLADYARAEVPFAGTVINIATHDGNFAVLEPVPASTLRALQKMFKQSRNIIWVTYGARSREPYHNIFKGLQRVVSLEMSDVQIQNIDFATSDDEDLELVSRKTAQLAALCVWNETGGLKNTLWCAEPEIIVHDGQVMIPRLRQSRARNQRYNSARRASTQENRTLGTDISIKLVHDLDSSGEPHGSQPSFILQPLDAGPGHLYNIDNKIRLTYSFVRPISITEKNTAYVSLGELGDNGGRVFVLTSSLDSHVDAPRSWTIPAPRSLPRALQALACLHAELLARFIIVQTDRRRGMAMLNPGSLLGRALHRFGATEGESTVPVLMTTSSTDEHAPPWIYVHPMATRRTIRSQMGADIFTFVDMDDGRGRVSATVAKSLPSGCRKIMRSHLFHDHARLDSSPEGLQRIGNHFQAAWLSCQAGLIPSASSPVPMPTPISLLDLTTANSSKTSRHDHQTIVSWQDFAEVPFQAQPASKQVSFDSGKTYWMVGLTGGLGLSLCQWMADRGARYFVLTSRNPEANQPWLEEMSLKGCTVKLLANDITNRGSVQQLYKKIRSTMPPVAGVAQGAMVLHDAVFPDLDADHLNKVLRPKVAGSVHLDELFPTDSLDFFVFLSSMAYVVGNRGQSAYSAANAFMAGLAAQRRTRGLAASVINVGGIVGEGYVSRQLTSDRQKALLQAGVDFISEPAFHEIFAEAILASRAPLSKFLDSCEISTGLRVDDVLEGKTFASNPIFQHLVPRASASAVIPPGGHKTRTTAIKAQLLEATTDKEVYDIVKSGLVAKLEASLHFDSEQTDVLGVSPDQLGVDSLVAVTIQEWFFKELRVEISVMKILNAPSIAQIIGSAQESLSLDMTPRLQIPTTPLPGTSGPDGRSTTEVDGVVPVSNSTSLTTINLKPASAVTDVPTSVHQRKSPIRMPEGSPSTSVDHVHSVELENTAIESPYTTDSSLMSTEEESTVDLEPCTKPTAVKTFERTLPMSFAQTRFWFLRLLVEDQAAFNVTTVVHLRGRVDADRLAAAFTAVGKRHEAIRTAFFSDNEFHSHMQGILPALPRKLEQTHVIAQAGVQEGILDVQRHVFDLVAGESIRLKLISLGDEEHWLVLGYHHIAVDGIGNRIFLSDLEKAYYETLHATGDNMLQYPDFATRQLQEYDQGLWAQQIDFWRDQFVDLPPPLPLLPLSRRHSRPAQSAFSSHAAKFILEPRLKQRIAQCCRRFNVTPFHFFLTVFGILLFRHAEGHVPDMCIGMADGNRKDADVLSSLGLFLNVLPLRLLHHPEQSFAEALSNVRGKSELAYANSRVPIDVLIKELRVPRSPSHHPLFQVFFNYRQNVQDSGTYLGCEAAGELISGGENPYDISIDVLDSSSRDNLVVLSVNSELYTAHDAEILKRSYMSLLQQLAKNPMLNITRPSLHLDEDIENAVPLGKGSRLGSRWPGTMVDRIDEMVSSYRDKVALTDGLHCTLTYGEMASRASQVATDLTGRGLRPNAYVGIYQTPGPQWICSLLGVLRTGATCVPMDVAVGAERLSILVQSCQPQIILVDATTVHQSGGLLQSSTAEVVDVSKVSGSAASIDAVFPNRAAPSDAAIVTYTSGTTGAPKGVVIQHTSYANFCEHGPPQWDISEGGEVVLQQSSWAFDMSLCQTLVCLGWGGALVVPDASRRSDPASLCQLIVSQGVTFTMATPTEYLTWIRHGGSHSTNAGEDLILRQSHWRTAMSGGEAITSALVQAFCGLKRPKFRLINCYGPCETTFACAASLENILPGNMENHVNGDAQSIGDRLNHLSPLPNYSIYIVDANMKPVPVGVPGQIAIGGAGVAEGYLHQEKLTKAAFIPDHASEFGEHGSFSTIHLSGDRGRLDTNGHLLLQGRVEGSTQIKIGGIRMDLQEIETTILETTSPCISQAVVSHRLDPRSGDDMLVAFVVFSPGAVKDEDQDKFLANLPRSLPLPQYMRPSVALKLRSIPWTASNKVDRAALDAVSLPPPQTLPVSVPGTLACSEVSNLEYELRQLWSAVLPGTILVQHDIENIGTLDFFHAGGSSLALIKLQRLMRDKLNISVSIAELFASSMFDQMVALVRNRSTGTASDDDSNGAGEQGIENWALEVAVPTDFTPTINTAASRKASTTPSTSPKVVVLTGATGFLGQEILRQLIAAAPITKIYCLAVRKRTEYLLATPAFSHPKVVVCPGDLSAPRLGLSDALARSVFGEADAVIHAGADVSFLKSYESLRPTNVLGTKELVRLSLPRHLHFHFVSSASVAQLSGRESLGPVSVARYPPRLARRAAPGGNDPGRSDGYVATKWAGEVFLENVTDAPGLDLPVVIHRPSNITGEEAPGTDLMSNLARYAQLTGTVPDTSTWRGQLDFVSVQTAARAIIEQVLLGRLAENGQDREDGRRRASKVRYVYESGEVVVCLDQLLGHVESSSGPPLRVLPFLQWVDGLEEAGMNPLLAVYLRRFVSGGRLTLPRLVKDET